MIDLLAAIRLHEPLWLALLIAPWLLVASRVTGRRATDRLQRFADAHLLQRLLRGDAGTTSGTRRAFVLAWGLAVLAASGPYLATPPAPEERRGIDITVIVDISPSMQVADVAPDRLKRAKLELTDFIARLESDRVALIAFSSNAYRLLPLTHDRDVFREYLDYLDPDLVFRRGSNLALALERAETYLQRDAQPARAIVLLSDGESHYPGAAAIARRLGDAGVPVLIVGFGTDAGGPVPGPRGGYLAVDGTPVASRIERDSLRQIAIASGGVYTDVRDDDGDWDRVFAQLDAIARDNRYVTIAPQASHALFSWLLAGALALFVIAGLRRPEIVALVALWPLSIAPPAAHAWVWQEQQAWDALTGGDCKRAAKLYQRVDTYAGWFGAGAAAWRCERWDDAIAAFARAGELATTNEERARAAYNRGNSHARRGELDAAARAFEEALALQPGYQPAARNLTLLRREQNAPRLGGAAHGDVAPPRADTRGSASDRPTSPVLGDVRSTMRAAPPSNASDPDVERHAPRSPNATPRAVDANIAGIGAALQQLDRLEENKREFLRNRMITDETRFGKRLEDKPW